MDKKYAINYLRCSGFSKEQIREIADALKDWPKAGHWINDEDTIGVYYCSECGGYVASYDDAYCKYCGAKMQEGGEE